MIISLIVILGLIIFLFFLLKRLRLSPVYGNRVPVMRILGTLSLAPKRAIALVEIMDQWLIVGIGTENVTLISRLERPLEVDTPDTGTQEQGRKFHSFLENIGLRQKDLEKRDTGRNAGT